VVGHKLKSLQGSFQEVILILTIKETAFSSLPGQNLTTENYTKQTLNFL
jgi:hypothetical protein